MITKSKERNMGMDVARVIATIYIIGYLHLKSYQGAEYIMPHFFGEAFVTKIMLGLFIFISGFFMASYSFENFKEDSIAFYTKRFFRFYPLFALAACTLFLIGYNPNPLKLVMTLTGTSTFIAQPGTLWFMVLLMMFYFFTPLIMKDGTVGSILIRSLFLFAIVLFISDLIGIIVLGGGNSDIRFFVYFPAYVLGIITGKSKNLMSMFLMHSIGITSLVILLCVLIISKESRDFSLVDICIIPLGVIGSLYLSNQISFRIGMRIKKIIMVIAYSSMCGYLFHRAVYIALQAIMIRIGVSMPYWFMAITFLPICLSLSYFLQLLYDKYFMRFILTTSWYNKLINKNYK